MDTKVVVKKPRQVAGILQNDHQLSNMDIKSRSPIGQFINLHCFIEFKLFPVWLVLSNRAHLLGLIPGLRTAGMITKCMESESREGAGGGLST